MFTRIFTLISILLIFTSCQESKSKTKATSSSKPRQSQVEPKAKSKESLFKSWKNNEEAITFLKTYGQQNQEQILKIETRFGSLKIRLYQNTPLHRANMVYLAKEHQYFNGTWFHRVSKGHVIQAGNNDEYTLKSLRDKIGKYKLPAEALGQNLHKYGSVAMARSYKNNPDKQSDPFEFYINLGQQYSEAQLDLMEEEYGITINERQRQIYSTIGGSPHLDQEHTVIGEVIEGMEVVEAISQVATDSGEWPLENIEIKVIIQK